MDKLFIRQYTLFFLILTLCTGTLICILIAGERDITKSDRLVAHTHAVIARSERFSSLIESMIANQREYALTANKEFLKNYNRKNDEIHQNIDSLLILTQDDITQFQQLKILKNNFDIFSQSLGNKMSVNDAAKQEELLKPIQNLDNLQKSLIDTNTAILKKEYDLLDKRLIQIENKKTRYFTMLFAGVFLASALLLLLNGFLLRAQSRRNFAENSLRETEERLRLAIKGTNDGIFDWDIKNHQLFWSFQFKKMLGYGENELQASEEAFERLIHEEDLENVFKTLKLYLNEQLAEFSVICRMQHKSGRWLWINARGKAIFNDVRVATRMVGAYTDISAVKDYEQRLEESKIQAEKANEAKSDFLAHMSHEIRTPLTAISGIAEIFEKNKDNLTDRQQKLVKTLNSSTAALKDLVNDILDFSKIESGELELNYETFDLSEVFQQVINITNLRAFEKNLQFMFDYSAVEHTKFYGDIMRLRQILVNLVGNALKFTERGSVTITAKPTMQDGNKILLIDITDTGIGISPDNQNIIFERFKQGDASVSRKYGGTGLGLAISKNLAHLMGGDIFVKSELNQGSIFSVTLPFKEMESDDLAGIKKLSSQITEKTKPILHNNYILLVEDYDGNIVVLSYLLDEMNYKYDIARTGIEAVDLWKKYHYDLILMDIQMPEMDGFSATMTIRKLEKENNLEETPIIGMTAHALIGDKDKCINAGMNSYLPKPIVENDLKQQILKFLKRSKTA